MNFELLGVRVTVSYPFLAVLTVFLTLDRTGLGGQMLCAALLHELGHLCVMQLFHQPPREIVLVPFGIRIVKRQSTVSYGKEALIYFAGPFVNLVFAAICTAGGGGLTRLAQVHLVLGLFNLMPIGLLDGSMLISCLAGWLGGPRFARGAGQVLSVLFLLPIVCGAVWLALHGRGNVTLIVTSLYLAGTFLFRRD